MKTQMKFQKILSLVTLIVAVITFVYALSFFTGNMSKLLGYISQLDENFTVADDFLYSAQGFVGSMVTICIIYLVVIALIYVTATNSRRNYYITNYVAIGLVALMSVFVALYGFINIGILMGKFYGLDWAALVEYGELYGIEAVSKSPIMFIIGIVVFLVVLVTAVLWVLNLIWKKKLMDGEKALLAQAPVAQVENMEVSGEGV